VARVSGRQKWRWRRRYAQVLAGNGSPVLSSDEEMVDEGRRDEAMSHPWSMRSIASWCDTEGRLEGSGCRELQEVVALLKGECNRV
jgi:hypothetical protein